MIFKIGLAIVAPFIQASNMLESTLLLVASDVVRCHPLLDRCFRLRFPILVPQKQRVISI